MLCRQVPSALGALLVLAWVSTCPCLGDVFPTIQITDNDFYDGRPKVNSNGNVAWEAQPVSLYSTDIYLYRSGYPNRITSNGYPDTHPVINDSMHIAWYGGLDNGYQVWRYMPATGTVKLVDPPTTEYHWNPQINNSSEVTWFRGSGNWVEIFHADADGNVTRLTDNEVQDINPVINQAGQIAWCGGWKDGVNLGEEIYLRDPDGAVTQLTDNPVSDTDPSINDYGEVAWRRGTEAYLYDRDGATTCIDSNSPWVPLLNNRGQVCWKSWDGSEWDIYLYDTDGSVTKIHDTGDTDSVYSGPIHSISHRGALVWRGHDGNDFEIYYWDASGAGVRQLTFNNYDDTRPHIRDRWIVWEGYPGGEDGEIFRANVPEPGTLATFVVSAVAGLLWARRRRPR